MGRDSLQYMLTGAVLIDQVGNVEDTCYNARFFKPIYLTHSTPLSVPFGRSIHEVALSLLPLSRVNLSLIVKLIRGLCRLSK